VESVRPGFSIAFFPTYILIPNAWIAEEATLPLASFDRSPVVPKIEKDILIAYSPHIDHPM
jgi:hypothetical protein